MMRTMLQAAVAAIALSILAGASYACSCAPIASEFFATVAAHNAKYPGQLTVVIGRVMNHYNGSIDPHSEHPTAMTIAVTHVLQGDVSAPTIVVNGDNGFMCRPYVTNFAIGGTFAFAVLKEPSLPGEYYLSICGAYTREIIAPPPRDER
jgi:hypothetical protein